MSQTKGVNSLNLIVRNKKTGEMLETDIDGLFATLHIQADGKLEIEDIGTCIDDSIGLIQDTTEKHLYPGEYEIVDIQFSKK